MIQSLQEANQPEGEQGEGNLDLALGSSSPKQIPLLQGYTSS